jgi:glycosyltransferase involved in cell wall biosynthesis
VQILTLANTPLESRLGSGYVVRRYADGLRERGHAVELLGPQDYEPFYGAARGIRYRQAAGMALCALRRVAAGSPDVVELYGGEGWLSALLLARRRRRRYIVVAHSNGLEPHATKLLAEARAAGQPGPGPRWFQLDLSRAESLGFRAVDGLVTVSAFDAAYALEHAYARQRVVAIDNPLPESYLGLAPAPQREPLVGFVGAWLPRKGIEAIVREVPVALREFPRWRLVLAGVGDGFSPARYFPADVVDRIDVVPRLERETGLKALYSRCAIVVLPSLYESFGLSASEAMACGAALVATPVGFAQSLADGKEALLVGGAGHGTLSSALRRLMGDDALRAAIGSAGRERVQRLSWRRAVDTLESTYLGWLTEHRAGRAHQERA